MRKTSMHLVLVGAAVLAALGPTGCSRRTERRARETYRDITGRPERRVDLNTASDKELARLPGLTDDDAARIIAHRPYGDKKGLLRKGVLGEKKYE
ncbi:MAG TPA: helix-hairpin-helix domain-containing protein, partial [Candidatus Binatia bacterium]|nr:helix-hairpin-helix domain-containing protein [Candidatus Binatia bacterium]